MQDASNSERQPRGEHQLNHAWWEERASLHPDTPMYQEMRRRLVEEGHCLHSIELSEFVHKQPIQSRDVLHLQCHVGFDSLSLAKLGARVSAVDFSKSAIEFAQKTSAELNTPARFHCADVLDFMGKSEFDFVFTSWGTICWLCDLDRWAQVVHSHLRPGGSFYMADFHPFMWVFDDRSSKPSSGEMKLGYPYFPDKKGIPFDSPGSYADRGKETKHNKTHEWVHSVSAVINALLGAGLSIEFFNEHNHGVCEVLPEMIRGEDRNYRLPEPAHNKIPLAFSLLAKRSE